ncbi:MAG: primase-helicase family protein [Woeseia sp.]
MKASAWLDENRPVDQMTWAPGEPMLIEDRLIAHGGWIDRTGCRCFNLYLPPQEAKGIRGNPDKAFRWIEHVRKLYDEDACHIVEWLAHRVQRPGEKINHAIVLGGQQGIGKDTILEPVKYAIGPWNFQEVSPAHLLGRFNGFVKSVILRVSEARDLGDVDRYGFYDHMKTYTAAPPDVLRCDEKNIREYAVMNVCGVVITTNHKADGIYLPPDDRRHFVAWSELTAADFTADYWNDLYGWFADTGNADIAAYLAELDLSNFDPKAPPPKTAAFWDIVDSNRAPEDAELADTLDTMNAPDALAMSNLQAYASDSFRDWLQDRRNRRQIPHRLEAAGYVPVRNQYAKDGLWKVSGKRQAIYARRDLSVRDRLTAAGKIGKDDAPW